MRSSEDIAQGDRRNDHPRFEKKNLKQNAKLLGVIDQISTVRGLTQSQVALAWLLSKGDDIVPIPSTLNPTHLRENIEACATDLNADEIATLEEAFPLGAATGTRYPAPQMHLMGQ